MSTLTCGCDFEHKPVPYRSPWCTVNHEAVMPPIEVDGLDDLPPPRKIPGIKPVTIVEADAHCTDAEMAARIEKTRAEHADILQKYHDVWYNAPHTWHYLHFLGVGMMKCPNDLWMYQELMTQHRPRVVIETGTYAGGSALWFAMLMDMLAIEGHVYSIDFEDHRKVQSHPRITFLAGDSTDPIVRDAIIEDLIRRELAGWPLLISLDADHSAEHVRKELELYAPLCKVGDWLVVEDTNISWGQEHVVAADPWGTGYSKCSCGFIFQIVEGYKGPLKCPKDDGKGSERGARGGIQDYVAKHPGEFGQDILAERWLLTMNPGGWLRRIAECQHG